MISKVSNTVISSSNSVKLVGVGKPKAVPPMNSLVNVNVIEKLQNGYKILVNGSLFQTKLPFKLHVGDSVLAKVINHTPFTVSMDSFMQTKNIDVNVISVMLSRLDIKETNLSKLVVKSVLGNKKILHKGKIKKLIEYIEEGDLKLDELQMGLLISMIWNHNDETIQESFQFFNNVFDISFEELCKTILITVESLYTQKGDPTIDDLLNIMVFNPANLRDKKSIISVRDKSKSFLDFFENLDFAQLNYSSNLEIRRLKSLMLKYILQKSLFNKFNTYPEFVIIEEHDVLALTIITYDRLHNSSGEILYKTSLMLHKNGLGDFGIHCYLGVDKLTGEISVDFNNLRKVDNNIEKLNNKVTNVLNIFSDIRVVLKEVFKNIHPDKTEQLKTINAIA